ncbi:hypothetical protein Daus18300_002538 [Diaporthe australafricana]|uniref:Uncharacterized protein n=1 Tax=Diaporthe australafricana TaxID=127596 RepID=A0ABR3XLS2_9PEZI
MALTIPAEDKDAVFNLTRPVWAAAALTNDVQSWEKEDRLFQKDEKTDMTNGVWILMREHSIGVEEAKRRILEKAKEHVAVFVKTLSQLHSRLDLSHDSRLFVEAMQYMVSGNLLWGISTPRYHSDQSLDELMVARMKYGWPNHREVNTPPTDVGNRGTKRTYRDANGVNGIKRMNGRNGVNGVKRTNGTNGINGKATKDLNGTNGVKTKRHKTEPCSGNLFKDSDAVLNVNLHPLSDAVICAPAEYVSSLPSKGVRDKIADALCIWLDVPAQDLSQIKHVIGLLHNASLMLDDVEDGSVLRRAQPTTHTVFGPAQTINSAGHQIILAMKEVRKLGNGKCLDIFSGLLGRYFQIRDDYMNLTSADYAVEKGFCEDLDEGKFSITLLHALSNAAEPEALLLRNLMSARHSVGKMSFVQKNLALSIMEGARSLDYTLEVLRKLHEAIGRELESVELQHGENKPFRFLLSMLKV